MPDTQTKIFYCRRCRKNFTAQAETVVVCEGKISTAEIHIIRCPNCNGKASNDVEKQKSVDF